MATAIKETPILYGEDAKRFLARMKEKRTETPEQKAKRLAAYEAVMSVADFQRQAKRDKGWRLQWPLINNARTNFVRALFILWTLFDSSVYIAFSEKARL